MFAEDNPTPGLETSGDFPLDPITQLPTLAAAIDALRGLKEHGSEAGVLVVDVEPFGHLENIYGWELFDGFLQASAAALRGLLGTVLAANDLVAVHRAGGSDFCVFTVLEEPEDAAERLQRKALQVEEALRAALDREFRSLFGEPVEVFVGCSLVQAIPETRIERAVYRALRRAAATRGTDGEHQFRLRETFSEILRRRRIRTMYQPIFDLNTMKVFGHESLTRGPVDSAFESPELLFEFAGEHEATWDLEQLCIESSAGHYGGTEPDLLFLNVEADSITALASRPGLLATLERLRDRVILEVTERSAIADVPAFRDALGALRRRGFRIAIDDAGSGYASLRSIAELRPNFLKIASTLVTGLHADSIKRDVVEMLVSLAGRIGAVCVAEGIETPQDLAECRRLGIPYGQGFFLGSPGDVASWPQAKVFAVEE